MMKAGPTVRTIRSFGPQSTMTVTPDPTPFTAFTVHSVPCLSSLIVTCKDSEQRPRTVRGPKVGGALSALNRRLLIVFDGQSASLFSSLTFMPTCTSAAAIPGGGIGVNPLPFGDGGGPGGGPPAPPFQ